MSQTIAIISIYPPQATLHGSGASGVGSYTKNLMINMDKKTRKNVVILCDYDVSPSCYTEDDMIIERSRQRKGIISWLQQIIKTLQKYPKITTIHIHHEFNMFGSVVTIPMFLILLYKLKKYKIIVTYHGVVDTSIIDTKYGKINSLPRYFPPVFLRFAFWFFYTISSRQISKVIVHEAYFKKVLMRYGYRDNQVNVILHGVEDKKISISTSDARTKLGISSEKKVLLYFGFLAGYKGVDLLLDAFKKLDSEKYYLILAGSAPKRTLADPVFRAWYEGVDERAKSMPGVTRMGFVPDEEIELIYSAADVLIVPYLYMLAASGPMSLALAYHKPFLVSDAFEPVIQEPTMRFTKNPSGLVSCIEQFFARPETITRITNDMRTDRLWENISKQTERLYSSLHKNNSTNGYQKIIYIDHQNIKLGIAELGRELDWQRLYIYLKDHYKPSQICIFIGYIESEKDIYEYYKQIGYSLFFKSTYQHSPNARYKGNVDTLLSHIATKDVLTLGKKLQSCIILSGDGDFDVIVKYWIRHGIDYLWLIPNDKKLSKLIQQTAQQKYIIPLNYLNNKLQKKTKTPTRQVL